MQLTTALRHDINEFGKKVSDATDSQRKGVSSRVEKQNITAVLDSMRDLLHRIEDVFDSCSLFLITGCATHITCPDNIRSKPLFLSPRHRLALPSTPSISPPSIRRRVLRHHSAPHPNRPNLSRKILLDIHCPRPSLKYQRHPMERRIRKMSSLHCQSTLARTPRSCPKRNNRGS